MTAAKEVTPNDGVGSSRNTPLDAPATPKTSIGMKLQSLWIKSGLKSRQLKSMFKYFSLVSSMITLTWLRGAWPPVIALAL